MERSVRAMEGGGGGRRTAQLETPLLPMPLSVPGTAMLGPRADSGGRPPNLNLSLVRSTRSSRREQRVAEETLDRLKKTTKAFKWAASDVQRVRRDRQLSLLSLFCLVVMFVGNALRWMHGREDDQYLAFEDLSGWLKLTLVIMQVLVCAFSAAAIYLLVLYYRMLLEAKHREWSQEANMGDEDGQERSNQYHVLHSSLLPKFAFEVFLHVLGASSSFLLFAFPDFPRDWPKSYHGLELCIILRMYLVSRLLHTNSSAFRNRAAIRQYFRRQLQMNWKVRWKLTLKINFYEHSIAMVTLSTFATMVLSSLALFLMEHESTNGSGEQPFNNLANCLWFSFVTFTTIGYGDMTPTTAPGRCLTAVLGFVSQLILAVFGGVITNKLAPSRQQQFIVSYLKKQSGETGEKHAAAALIQTVYRAWRLQQKCALMESPKGGKGKSSAVAAAGSSLADNARRRRKHKQNRVYAAVKRFRRKRCDLFESHLHSNDPVLDQKLDRLQEDVQTLTRCVRALLPRGCALSQDSDSPPVSPLKKHMTFLNGWGTERSPFRTALADPSPDSSGPALLSNPPTALRRLPPAEPQTEPAADTASDGGRPELAGVVSPLQPAEALRLPEGASHLPPLRRRARVLDDESDGVSSTARPTPTAAARRVVALADAPSAVTPPSSSQDGWRSGRQLPPLRSVQPAAVNRALGPGGSPGHSPPSGGPSAAWLRDLELRLGSAAPSRSPPTFSQRTADQVAE